VIKKTKNLLTQRITVLRINNNFPDNVKMKYYLVAGYLFNCIPIKKIEWYISTGGFEKK
jgi:hypothetical protein